MKVAITTKWPTAEASWTHMPGRTSPALRFDMTERDENTSPGRVSIRFDRKLLDQDALRVVEVLRRHGHESYLVGGCVRDLLLGRRPKDFDVATSATPEEVRRLFRRNSRIIGRRFRLVHVYFGHKNLEVATFRANPLDGRVDPNEWDDADAEEEDGAVHLGPTDELLIRRDNVFGTAAEDARRRDFTINGLFYDPLADEVLDWVGGLEDIRARRIRTIGNPNVRFREDPVRILRAVKFAARLDMEIETKTHDAMIRYRKQVQYCPKARVLEEIRRILAQGSSRAAVELAHSLAVLDTLIPEVAQALETPGAGGRLRRRLAAADEMVAAGVELSRPVLLANLLSETLEPDWMEAPDPSLYLDEALRPTLLRLGVPRRDSDRIKQILLAQRRLTGRRRWRKSQAKAEFFPEAVLLFELGVLAGLCEDPASLKFYKKLLGWPLAGLGPVLLPKE